MLKALMYNIVNNDYQEDVLMYLSLLDKSFTIVEFGSGTGRITKELLKNGFKVIGIEIEQEYKDFFLNYCHKNGIDNEQFSYCNELENIPDDCQIILPFNVLLYLSETALEDLFCKLSHTNFNKIIFDVDNISKDISQGNLTEKKFEANSFLFKETTFIENNNQVIVNNLIISQNKISSVFSFRLYMHKNSFIIGLLKKYFYKYEHYGDFTLNSYQSNHPKMITIVYRHP